MELDKLLRESHDIRPILHKTMNGTSSKTLDITYKIDAFVTLPDVNFLDKKVGDYSETSVLSKREDNEIRFDADF